MSLDKAIEHGKEKRKQYRGAKAVDPWCRNHGNCKCCQKSRQLKNIKREESAEIKFRKLKPNEIRVEVVENCWECPHCLPIGEGDHWCDKTEKIVIVEYIPSDYFCYCKANQPKQGSETNG